MRYGLTNQLFLRCAVNIYIHGTAQEQLIGQSVSHGCIRMLNDDVIALFDLFSVNTPVLISQRAINLTDLT